MRHLVKLSLLLGMILIMSALWGGTGSVAQEGQLDLARTLGLEPLTNENADRLTEIQRIGKVTEQRSPVVSLSFSPDGTRIVSSLYDADTVEVWNAVTGELLSVLEGSYVSYATFSPDGTRVAAITGEGIYMGCKHKRGAIANLQDGYVLRSCF